MNWIFNGTLQYLEDPQMWLANARDTAESWVYVKVKRSPFCYVEEINPDDILKEMEPDYDGFFFAECNNLNKQAHVGWIKMSEDVWSLAKMARITKMLFCRKKTSFSGSCQQIYPSSLV